MADLAVARLIWEICVTGYKYIAAIREQGTKLNELYRVIKPDLEVLQGLLKLIAETVRFRRNPDIEIDSVFGELVEAATMKIGKTVQMLRFAREYNQELKESVEANLSAARQYLILCVTISTNQATHATPLAEVAEVVTLRGILEYDSISRFSAVPRSGGESQLEIDVKDLLKLHRYCYPRYFLNEKLWISVPIYQRFFGRVRLAFNRFTFGDQVQIYRLCERIAEYGKDSQQQQAVKDYIARLREGPPDDVPNREAVPLLERSPSTERNDRNGTEGPRFVRWQRRTVRRRDLNFLNRDEQENILRAHFADIERFILGSPGLRERFKELLEKLEESE